MAIMLLTIMVPPLIIGIYLYSQDESRVRREARMEPLTGISITNNFEVIFIFANNFIIFHYKKYWWRHLWLQLDKFDINEVKAPFSVTFYKMEATHLFTTELWYNQKRFAF